MLFRSPAAADNTAHGGVAQDGGDGDGGIGDEGGHRLRDHDLNDGLHRGSAHTAGHLDDIGIELSQAAFYQAGHKGKGSHDQRHNGGNGTHRGAHNGPGEGEQQDHKDKEG